MTGYEIISSLVSLLAVLLSLVAIVRTRRTESKLIELEEIHAKLSRKHLSDFEKKELESERANLGVTLLSSGSGGKFIIKNHGPSSAFDAWFSLTEDNEHNPLVNNDCEKKIPYPRLNVGEEYSLLASFPLSVTQMVYHLDLRWTNKDRTQSRKSFSVSRNA